MEAAFVTSVVAVAGTLFGAVVTGVVQHVSQRSARRAAAAAARAADGLAALTDLVGVLADHRRAMYVREELRLRGGNWEAARAESHATRSAITAPLLRVQLLLPALAPAAQDAARATYALRRARALDVLDVARDNALAACDRLVASAAGVISA